MKDETKKKIKKGALIALQVTLGGFALLGMLSTGALVKSCSKGEINTSAVVATTPVFGQRIKKANSTTSNFQSWDDIRGKTFNLNTYGFTSTDMTNGTYYYLVSPYSSSGTPMFTYLGRNSQTCEAWNMDFHRSSSSTKGIDFYVGNSNASVWTSNSRWQDRQALTPDDSRQITFLDVDFPTGKTEPVAVWWTAFNSWATYVSGAVTGIPLTADYAYCGPVGDLPTAVPQDYTSVTIQFQADTGYGFPDTGEEIPGYTQIYSEGLVIDSYSYGGYLGNGMYNAIEIQCSRDSDPPADSCHISVSALATSGFEYPEWKTLRVLGTHCTIYMADDQFDSDGVVHLQAYPDTGYYFDQDRAFIGNQLKEYYGAEVVMYDLSTGGLYLTIRKNAEKLVLNESPYIEITPLAGNVPVGGGDMGQAFDLLRDGFSALLPLFMIQVLPGITLGMLLMVPFIVILILFILKVVHK